MADEGTESLHDPNWFEFAGPPFVIAPFPRPMAGEALLRGLARGESEGQEERTRWVVVFTDLDQAERFVEAAGAKGRIKPLTFPTPGDFEQTLVGLLAIGETHVGIDPEGARVRCIDIPRILAAIRGQRR